MLRLNIISQELKKEIKLIVVYKFLKRLSFLIFSLLLIYSVAFQASRFILLKYSEENTSKNIINSKNSEEYIQQVRDINEKITNVETVQAESVVWSSFMQSLSSTISDNITLNQLTINKSTESLIISGTAKTRDSLLELKDVLNGLTYLSEVDLPISSLLKKEDIVFTISAKFLNYEF